MMSLPLGWAFQLVLQPGSPKTPAPFNDSVGFHVSLHF